MTRRQLELAVKLYSLATMAHLDLGDADNTAEADKVKRLSAKRAMTKLRNLGVDRSEITTIYDAIDAAQRLRP